MIAAFSISAIIAGVPYTGAAAGPYELARFDSSTVVVASPRNPGRNSSGMTYSVLDKIAGRAALAPLSRCCSWARSFHRNAYSKPAARAQRYLAPSTATGFSVVYGYATTPRSYRYSEACSTSTSPTSEATTGL